MTPPRILVAESRDFAPRAAALLRAAGAVTLTDLDRAGLLAAVGSADVLWVRLRHQIDAEVMAAAPRLRIVASPTTGLNHIDVEEAERRGIRVLSLRGETEFLRDIRATAEHTVALTLALLRRLPAAVAHVAEGGWERDRFRGHELYGRTAGVVGYGRLGRIVARYLGAFGMRVLAADPNVHPAEVDPDVTLLPLAELLPLSDVVTVHVNLDRESYGFFGSEQFAAMKQGAWFVNTARAEVTDEQALLDALCSGHLAGAAVDVLAGESAVGVADHPVVRYAREHDNLLITPHIGGCTAESMEMTECFLAQRLAGVLSAVAPGHVVPRMVPDDSAVARAT